MAYLEISPEERRRLKETLRSAYSSPAQLKELAKDHVPSIEGSVHWEQESDLVRGRFVDAANEQGLLDRALASASADRPYRPDLKTLALYFSQKSGWTAPLEVHDLDLGGSLEALTIVGDPFVGPSRLARWLIAVERQVCQVRCGVEHGTGFLVAPDLVLTNYHVVEKHLANGVPASKVQVRFDYREGPRGEAPADDPDAWLPIAADWEIPHAPHSQSDITLEGEPQPHELDYALLRLRTQVGSEPDENGETRGWIDLSTSPELPDRDLPILIVQHPGSDSPPPLQMPLKIAFATPGFETPNANGTRVAYRPSTKKGSSGSPVFDQQLKPVALHHNRGQISEEAVDLVKNNRGIPLARIRESLDDEVRALLISPG